MDRNKCFMIIVVQNVMSLSARRAWIEITPRLKMSLIIVVALRKESVDRNCKDYNRLFGTNMSLSARRAWIEIGILNNLTGTYRSLSARRAWIEIRQ